MYITAQGPRLRNDLYCVEWDVKLLVYHTVPRSPVWKFMLVFFKQCNVWYFIFKHNSYKWDAFSSWIWCGLSAITFYCSFVMCSILIFADSRKWVHYYDNFDKCRTILIILSVLNLGVNCKGKLESNLPRPSKAMLHYLVKIDLYICTALHSYLSEWSTYSRACVWLRYFQWCK